MPLASGWLAFEGTVTHADLCEKCKSWEAFNARQCSPWGFLFFFCVCVCACVLPNGRFFSLRNPGSSSKKCNFTLESSLKQWISHLHRLSAMLKKGKKGKDILNSWQDYASTLTLVHMGTLYWKGHGIQNNPYNLALIPLPDFKTISQYNNISSPTGKLKKCQGEWTKAPHFGNIKRSPAELWQSGNPWQCDFCYLLCIKSRCQEPSPPQPRGRGRIHPAPACPIFCLQRPPRHSGDVQAASEPMWPGKKNEAWVKLNIHIKH